MKEFMTRLERTIPSRKFAFRCRQCGECCRNVKESVPLEPLDAFRLAKYLRERDESVTCIDDVLAKYAVPVLLHESGFTIYMLKTVGPDDACVFLKDNRCTIHEANPKACRTYPISVGPDSPGSYEYFLSLEQPHHFKGPQTTVKRWVQNRCSQQDYQAWNTDFSSVTGLAQLLKQVPQEEISRAIMLFLWYRYSNYDLDKSFIQQFERNTQKLIAALKKLNSKEFNRYV